MNFLAGILTQLISLGGGLANGILGLFTSIMSSGFQAATKFHQEGIALGRDLGLGLNQANAYTKILTDRTQELAAKYGVTSEAIFEVQRGISDATGKQLLLNNAQAEGFVQANKLVGAQTTNKFVETIMNGMGGQVNAVQGAISKAYATAAKQGLNAQKFSKVVADNLSMANRLNFRNGIDGITRMAAMAEKFGLNMRSVETAANQFMELDSAIEHSAQLQMLGGTIGASFGNPLTNAYEAQYDPEAFAKRMEDAIKGMAKFDKSKGYATIDPVSQDILRNYAKAMGLNAEEVISNSKKQAEVRYKENVFASQIGAVAGTGPEAEARKNFILNNSQVTPEGKLQVNGKDISQITEKEWKDMMAFDGKSDTDILKDQALSLKSIKEQLQGSSESVAAAFAKGLKLEEKAKPLIDGIEKLGRKVEGISQNIGEATGKAIEGIFKWVVDNKDVLKSIANGVVSVSSFLKDNWKALLATIIGLKIGGAILRTPIGGGATIGGKASGMLNNLGQRMSRSGIFKPTMDTYRYYNQRYGGSKLKNFGSALKNSWKTAPKLTKATGIAGVALGAVEGATAFMDYSTKKKQLQNQLDSGEITREEYNSQINEARVDKNKSVGSAVGGTIGAAIGTAFGGPIGAIVAGYIGDKLGGFIGKHWDGITKRISNAWNSSIDWISNATSSVIGGIGDKLSRWGESVSNWWGEIASPAISESMSKIKDKAKSFMNGIGEKFNSFWDEHGSKIRAFSKMNPVTAILTEVVEFFKGPKEYIASAKQGFKNLIKSIADFPKTVEQWLYDFTKDKKWLPTMGRNYREEEKPKEKKAYGGIVGGNSYSGDKILTGLNSGEMVLNKQQQAQLFNFINNASSVLTKVGSANGVTYYNASNNGYNKLDGILSKIFNTTSNIISAALDPNNGIKTLPIGTNSFKQIPKSSDGGGYNDSSVRNVTVRDFNVNLSGTIRLDAGNYAKNLDVSKLLEDSSFISSLKDMIKQSINNDINNGRFMNDIPSMRGLPSQVTTWGRK